MQEQDYTKRELDTHFESLKSLILDLTRSQNEKLDRIEQQVTKTNGRVTKLEFWREGLMAKITALSSAIAVGWILLKTLIFK